MKQLFVVLRGTVDRLAEILFRVLSDNLPGLCFPREAWKQLIIGLYFDPSRQLLERLIEEAALQQSIRKKADILLDGEQTNGDGRILLLTSERLQIGLRYLDETSFELTVDFGEDNNQLAASILGELFRQRVDKVEDYIIEVANSIVAERASIR